MFSHRLQLGPVIAAVPTPFDVDQSVEPRRLIAHCEWLLDNGCDGINLLGTTGEATSLSLSERSALMREVAASGLPMDRLMVGTGAASVIDAAELTALAGELGFAAALVLPPFYYKNVPDAGVTTYFDRLVAASTGSAIPLMLYHFPDLSGVPFHADLAIALARRHPNRIRGIKDSAGDTALQELLTGSLSGFSVFPANESTLIDGKLKGFAGCISATANLNAGLCQTAWTTGDVEALAGAVAIRSAVSALTLIPAIKFVLSRLHNDPVWEFVRPPFVPLSGEDKIRLLASLSKTVLSGRL